MIRPANNKLLDESNMEPDETAEVEMDDDCEEEDDDSDLDEINRLLNSADHIEPEPVGDPESDNKEDELDEIIRLGGGEETFGFEEGLTKKIKFKIKCKLL
jgi:hypothetical protein